jgi:hypothetical protein
VLEGAVKNRGKEMVWPVSGQWERLFCFCVSV